MKIIIFLYLKDTPNLSSQIHKLSETSFLIRETTYEIIETNYKKKTSCFYFNVRHKKNPGT